MSKEMEAIRAEAVAALRQILNIGKTKQRLTAAELLLRYVNVFGGLPQVPE